MSARNRPGQDTVTATVTRTDDVSSRVRTRKPGGGRGRRAKPPVRRTTRWYVVRGLLLVLAATLLWLVGGLLWAAHTVSSQAAVAQSELELFRDTLKAGDDKAAKTHLLAGEEALADATGAAGSGPVRVAGTLPYLGQTVADLDHLLAAAGIMTGSARDALDVYENFSGDDSELFHDGEFSIPAIQRAQGSIRDIEASLSRAEAELDQVRGEGYKGADALAKQQSAMKQIDSLRTEIQGLTPLLDALPGRGRRRGSQDLPGGNHEPGRDARLRRGAALGGVRPVQGRQDVRAVQGRDVGAYRA